MKIHPLIPSRKLTAALLVATTAAAQAAIIANESFRYTDGALVGQTTTGFGFTGEWTLASGFPTNNSTTAFFVNSGSLTMNGVYSSGGKVSFSREPNYTAAIAQKFSSPLSATGTLYGSYLFSLTADNGTTGKTVGGIMVNTPGQNDNSGTFVWAANGYNNSSNNVEGPNIRVAGTGSPIPAISLTIGTTYVMLFEFNAMEKTTSAWVLNENQLANFYASLNAATLNSVAQNTEAADGVVWRATVTSTGTLGAMEELTLLGLSSTQGLAYGFDIDEIRFSDTSLLEAVAVPEPSTIAFGLALGAFAVSRSIRRRRKA
jgi:PEP-CTERM motif.